jgi:hypothetical protein
MMRPLFIGLAFACIALSPNAAQEAKPPEAKPGTACEKPIARDCTPKTSCEFPVDNRECSFCVVTAFGRCLNQIRDPACEAAKEAQRKMATVKQAQCESDKELEKKSCDLANSIAELAYSSCVSAAILQPMIEQLKTNTPNQPQPKQDQ